MSDIPKPQTDEVAEHKTQEPEAEIKDKAKAIKDFTEKIDSELNSADHSSMKQEKDLEGLKKEFEKNIKSALDMMKKLDTKASWDILKDGIRIPNNAVEELLKMVSFYEKKIEKNSHASASAKLKNIFGVNVKKGSKEENRRKNLRQHVIELGATLDAYVYFFIGCSNSTFNPLLAKFNNTVTKLGPKGKGYIDSASVLRTDELWAKNYAGELSRLSKSYCFGKAANFYNENVTYTLYRHRVKTVYKMCRDKAAEFKEKMCKAFTATFDKFKSGANNSYLAGTGGKLFEAYNNMRKNLKTSNEQFEKFTETISNNPKIFGNLSVHEEMRTFLANIKKCIDTTSSLSKIFANNIAIYVMTVDNDTLNKKTISLLNHATDLFNVLKELKKLLLAGNHVNAKEKLSSFDQTYECANDALKSYKDTLNSIATLEPLRLKNVLSVIEDANSKIMPYNKEFAKQLNKAKDAVGKFKGGKVTIVLSVLKTIITTFSGLLGPYTTILNTVLSCFGSLVITPLVNLAYDT